MRYGLQLFQWGAQPPFHHEQLIATADEVGFEAVFTAEAWGSDAFTPLAWWGSQTERIKLGTSIVQLSGRTPTSVAMHAVTLDHLSKGRLILGLGVSGPQVVEGWYGQPFSQPLARTREAIDIIRQVLARDEPVRSTGPHYPLPYTGPGSVGLGRPLKSIVHPLRADLPIWLGAEGPKNVALAAEIADGWLPLFYTPGSAAMYGEWLDEGFARPGARRTRAAFEIAATCRIEVTPDNGESRRAALDRMKPEIALYMGGMGAKTKNFHKNVFDRLGYAEITDRVQDLFLAGRREEAAALIPDALVDELHIIGDAGWVRERVALWEESGVTTLITSCTTPEDIRQVARVLL